MEGVGKGALGRGCDFYCHYYFISVLPPVFRFTPSNYPSNFNAGRPKAAPLFCSLVILDVACCYLRF